MVGLYSLKKMRMSVFFLLLAFCPAYRSFSQISAGLSGYLERLPPKGSIRALSTTNLPETVRETSGLILWKGLLWTINDSQNKNEIYSFPPDSVEAVKAYSLGAYVDNDWEEISQDSDFVYVGDFGNNYRGNRKDLRVLKVSKKSLEQNRPVVEVIRFSYPDQTDFSVQKSNHTDFDCEAMVVDGDSIYLFTKQWLGKGTSLYAFPKQAGTYVADYKASFDVDGLVTGATYRRKDNLLVLCGYARNFMFPFLYVFYDFRGNDFFGGKKSKLILSNLMFHQVEGVATSDGIHYYLSNEKLDYKSIIKIPPQIHRIDLEKASE